MKTYRSGHRIVVLLVLLTCAWVRDVAGAAALSYLVTDLGALGGTDSLARGITASEQDPINDEYHAFLLTPLATLAGDFNRNGVVDAGDYVDWRNGLEMTYTQNDDGVWRAHFGQSAGSGAALPSAQPLSAAVPEPASWVLLCLWMIAVAVRRNFEDLTMRVRETFAAAIVVLLFLGLPANTVSGQMLWVADGVGNWNVVANWSAGVPNKGTDAQINNGGTARLFDPLSRVEIMAWTDGPKRVGRILLSSHVAHMK